MTRHLFAVAAAALASAEAWGYLLLQYGAEVWEDSPYPLLAFLIAMLWGIVLPVAATYMLWVDQRRQVVAFLLLLGAAATIGWGALYALLTTVVVFYGEPLTAEMTLGYLPIIMTVACLSLWFRIKPARAIRAA